MLLIFILYTCQNKYVCHFVLHIYIRTVDMNLGEVESKKMADTIIYKLSLLCPKYYSPTTMPCFCYLYSRLYSCTPSVSGIGAEVWRLSFIFYILRVE